MQGPATLQGTIVAAGAIDAASKGDNTALWLLAGAALAITVHDAPAAERITNEVPSVLARVIPGEGPFPTLGPPGRADVFVTAAEDIAGMTPEQIAQRLTISPSSSFTVIEFETPAEGLASPVLRSDPGFIGGGRTAGGAREFILPNGPVPAGATVRVVQ
jgi:hypothetical protein